MTWVNNTGKPLRLSDQPFFEGPAQRVFLPWVNNVLGFYSGNHRCDLDKRPACTRWQLQPHVRLGRSFPILRQPSSRCDRYSTVQPPPAHADIYTYQYADANKHSDRYADTNFYANQYPDADKYSNTYTV